MPNEPSTPTEGTFFTLQPVPPPQPKATTHWGFPLVLGLLAIPLLMVGFGLVQQQQPVPTPSVSAFSTPSVETSPTTTIPPTTAAQPLEPTPAAPQLEVLLPTDSATLSTARIYSPGIAVNFRAAPSLHSQVIGVLMHGDLVELTAEQRVQQDGVTWMPVRYRGQFGWFASNFLTHRRSNDRQF